MEAQQIRILCHACGGEAGVITEEQISGKSVAVCLTCGMGGISKAGFREARNTDFFGNIIRGSA